MRAHFDCWHCCSRVLYKSLHVWLAAQMATPHLPLAAAALEDIRTYFGQDFEQLQFPGRLGSLGGTDGSKSAKATGRAGAAAAGDAAGELADKEEVRLPALDGGTAASSL